MYKNILNTNRRSEYANKNLNKYSSQKLIVNRSLNRLKKSLKFQEPLKQINASKSSQRIYDDLSDPNDPKNRYFALLKELNSTQAIAYTDIMDQIKEKKKYDKQRSL